MTQHVDRYGMRRLGGVWWLTEHNREVADFGTGVRNEVRLCHTVRALNAHDALVEACRIARRAAFLDAAERHAAYRQIEAALLELAI